MAMSERKLQIIAMLLWLALAIFIVTKHGCAPEAAYAAVSVSCDTAPLNMQSDEIWTFYCDVAGNVASAAAPATSLQGSCTFPTPAITVNGTKVFVKVVPAGCDDNVLQIRVRGLRTDGNALVCPVCLNIQDRVIQLP